jgi:hypothetical protein
MRAAFSQEDQSMPGRNEMKTPSPKKRKPSDMTIAWAFKRGNSMGAIAFYYDNAYSDRWDVRRVEAAIRRVMRRGRK